ncbi:MAG: hypothetical protein IPM32_04520 [Ignavibacteriae bacterium]|nr:hypothetical protein [Ignavibacteriota bacterium]
MFFTIKPNSCAPIYVPNIVNVPLFTKKDEAIINANYGTNGINFQGAYSIFDNFAVQINTENRESNINAKDKKRINANNPQNKLNYYETAFGYYYPFNETMVLEIFGGGGLGNSSALDNYNIFSKDKTYAEGEFYKMFIQGDVGSKMKFFEGGIAFRFAYLEFTKYKFENFEFTGKPSSIFFEPAIFERLGGPYFKFQGQIIFASKLLKEDFVMYETVSISLGFMIRIKSLF